MSAGFWVVVLLTPMGRVPSGIVAYSGLELGNSGLMLGIGLSVVSAVLLSTPGARAWCRR